MQLRRILKSDFFRIRLVLVALASYLVFSQLLIPLRIQGRSMEPTYPDGGFTFCWRGRYLFAPVRPGEVVAISLAGRKVMLLKRVVAVAGDTVAFREGRLLRNGQAVDEPYVRRLGNWNLAVRTVEPGKVYVVGDNRAVAIDDHVFGQVALERIVGGVLW